MRQDQTRNDRVDKIKRAEGELANEGGEIDGQDPTGFDDNQRNMGMTASQIWHGQISNENPSKDGEALSQEHQHESFDRASLTHNQQEELSYTGPSTRTVRESSSQKQRNGRDQVTSSKENDRKADDSLDTDSNEGFPDVSSRSEASSQNRSDSYDPYKKEQYLDDAYGRHSYDSGQSPQTPRANPPSDDRHRRHAHHETRESHTAWRGHNSERGGSRADLSKHTQASGNTSRTSEQEEREIKRRFMEFMLQDPSKAYDHFLLKSNEAVMQMKKQSDEWQARVSLLTEEMLAGRDRFQPTTDGDLQGKMNKLREDVKALAREMNPRQISEKIFAGTLKGKQLDLLNIEKTWAKDLRAPILQSSIWRVLIRHTLGTPFVVFGDEGAQVERTWKTLFGESAPEHAKKSVAPNSVEKSLDGEEEEVYPATPKPEELCEKWKSMTAIRLKDKVLEKSIYTGREAKNALQKMLYALSDSSNDPSWSTPLKNVLHSATELAVAMAQQRSRLELFVPDLREIAKSTNHCCDGKTIDFDEGVEGPLSGEAVLIVTPGLRKWGDGFGGKLSTFVDLEAAQVKCI